MTNECVCVCHVRRTSLLAAVAAAAANAAPPPATPAFPTRRAAVAHVWLPSLPLRLLPACCVCCCRRRCACCLLLAARVLLPLLLRRYTAAKRFGLEGCETLIPGMKALIDRITDLECKSIVIGMPHRGAYCVTCV